MNNQILPRGMIATATLHKLLEEMKNLTDEEIMKLFSEVEVEKVARTKGGTAEKPLIACPHCGSIGTVRTGKTAAGTQRYICKDCKKTFTPKTNTIFSNSNLDQGQWYKIFKGIVERVSLQKIAEDIGMSVKCAWYNKHKIQTVLLALYGDQDTFQDIAECDECFARLSFKGKRDPNFFITGLGRLPRHRRSSTEKKEYLIKNGYSDIVFNDPEELDRLLYKSNFLPGTNRDNVCILSGKDRSGNLYISPACLGNAEPRHIQSHFQERFASDAILVTDSSNAYGPFAKSRNLRYEKLESGQHSRGPYSLSRINAVHSNLRDYMPKSGKNLLATKYLDLGLIFFWWQEKHKDLTPSEQVEALQKCIKDNPGVGIINYHQLRHRPLSLDTKNLIPQYV